MFGKMIKYAGYSIWVWCSPSTTKDELQEKARAILHRNMELGLKDYYLRESLFGVYSTEHLLAQQLTVQRLRKGKRLK